MIIHFWLKRFDKKKHGGDRINLKKALAFTIGLHSILIHLLSVEI